MAKRSGRSLLFVCTLFVFACLLISGGSRLIGSDVQENPIPVRSAASIRAVLTNAITHRAQVGVQLRHEQRSQYMQALPAPEDRSLNHLTLCDANGNVLGEKTYMRAVYQSFVLGDGFV